MPKRSRSSNYYGKGTMVVTKKRKLGYRSRAYGKYRKNVRNTLYKSLEKHQAVLRLNDNIDSTGAFHTLIRCPGQGISPYSDSATQKIRDGSRIQPVSLRVDAVIDKGDATNVCRVIMVQSKTVFSGITDLLQAYPTSGTVDVWSTYKRENMGNKYKVISDKKYFFSDQQPRKVIKWKCPKRYLKQIHYNGDGINDYTKNMIFMVFLSDSLAPAHPVLTGLVNSRVCQI